MNNALKNYIKQYTQLEQGVQELMLQKCATLCQQCTCYCCDAIICSEAIESPFLKRVHQETNRYSELHGFTSETGCTLKQGRPPVCYEYFCDDHFYHQPDDRHAELLKILGALLNHAIQNAQADTPLTEIMEEEALDQLDFQRMGSQLQESFQALEIIRTFFRDKTLSDESHKLLKLIHLSEEFRTT